MELSHIRIPVERRANGLFAGDVAVTFWTDRGAGHLTPPLSNATLNGIGLPWGYHLRLRKCEFCGGLFIAHYSAGICGGACAKASRQAWRDAHRPPPSLPRAPSKTAQRRAALAAATCQVCATPLEPKRLTARFCSGRCRQKHYRGVVERCRAPALTMFSDAKARKDRFAICDAVGKPLWFGKFFDNDKDYNGEQSSGEMAAAKKAVWLTSKIKEAVGADTIRLTLKVDAEWLTYANGVALGDEGAGGKARALGFAARRLGVDLWVEHIRGVDNPADAYTVGTGFKSWKKNDLKALVVGPDGPASRG
jgi:hypothetical protein